jgi:UDP-2,4-diacetamido-2,4,6-trideoxy-beta-L-altropyranose hydrolase
MNIVFRVDSSITIGTGHVMRCITLAKRLVTEHDVNILFITRENKGSIDEFIEKSGFKVITLSTINNSERLEQYLPWLGTSQEVDAIQTLETLEKINISSIDVLIIDHYSLDIKWEKKLKNKTKKIIVIDDLADRKHLCDILLDQNMAPNYGSRYNELVPSECKKFLGISYCLLRDDFFQYQKITKPRNTLKNLFIFFGGIDKDNATLKSLYSIESMIEVFDQINVVVGKFNPHKKEIRSFIKQHKNVTYLEQVSNIAELMFQADLSIGAGGATTGERITLGLPSIVFSMAENQNAVSKHLDKLGYITFLGGIENITQLNLESILQAYIDKPTKLFNVSHTLLDLSKSKLHNLTSEILKRDNNV